MATKKRIYWEVSSFIGGGNHPRKWRVKRGSRVMAVRKTKSAALHIAVNMCREDWQLRKRTSELYIKRKDGSIQDKRTYPRCTDPRKSKG